MEHTLESNGQKCFHIYKESLYMVVKAQSISFIPFTLYTNKHCRNTTHTYNNVVVTYNLHRSRPTDNSCLCVGQI